MKSIFNIFILKTQILSVAVLQKGFLGVGLFGFAYFISKGPSNVIHSATRFISKVFPNSWQNHTNSTSSNDDIRNAYIELNKMTKKILKKEKLLVIIKEKKKILADLFVNIEKKKDLLTGLVNDNAKKTILIKDLDRDIKFAVKSSMDLSKSIENHRVKGVKEIDFVYWGHKCKLKLVNNTVQKLEIKPTKDSPFIPMSEYLESKILNIETKRKIINSQPPYDFSSLSNIKGNDSSSSSSSSSSSVQSIPEIDSISNFPKDITTVTYNVVTDTPPNLIEETGSVGFSNLIAIDPSTIVDPSTVVNVIQAIIQAIPPFF